MPSKAPKILTAAFLVMLTPAVRAAEVAPADQISEFRLKHGEVRVTRDATLERIAADQAREMAAKNDLSHEVLGLFGKRIAPSMAGRAAASPRSPHPHQLAAGAGRGGFPCRGW